MEFLFVTIIFAKYFEFIPSSYQNFPDIFVFFADCQKIICNNNNKYFNLDVNVNCENLNMKRLIHKMIFKLLNEINLYVRIFKLV